MDHRGVKRACQVLDYYMAKYVDDSDMIHIWLQYWIKQVQLNAVQEQGDLIERSKLHLLRHQNVQRYLFKAFIVQMFTCSLTKKEKMKHPGDLLTGQSLTLFFLTGCRVWRSGVGLQLQCGCCWRTGEYQLWRNSHGHRSAEWHGYTCAGEVFLLLVFLTFKTLVDP